LGDLPAPEKKESYLLKLDGLRRHTRPAQMIERWQTILWTVASLPLYLRLLLKLKKLLRQHFLAAGY
jgi:hypothetical protein